MRNRIAPTFVLAALLAGAISAAKAGETFKSLRGGEYHNCAVIGKDPHGVTFRHSEGIAKLAYENLPKGLQDRFGYDKVEAKRFVDSHRPKPVVRKATKKAPAAAVPAVVKARTLASYPRGRQVRNPYSLTGSLHNPAAYGASFGGFVQPYFSGSFGAPNLVTSVPGGFFTPTTLRVGARPILDGVVAPGMGSYSQMRDARASAVRAAARATTTTARHARGGSRGGRR